MNTPFMNNLNSSSNHPLIANTNEYAIYRKYVSIHSEDRDILKWPNPALFEIELPEDITNVATVRLSAWTFPANYNTFSLSTSNVAMTFKIEKPYNPGEHMFSDPLANAIFVALNAHIDKQFLCIISEGFYNPTQIVTELTNRFNTAVSKYIINYFTLNPAYTSFIQPFKNLGGYQEFVIVYNTVQQRIWFGNRSSSFVLTNDTNTILDSLASDLKCIRNQLPDFSNWGLPQNIGLTRCETSSISNPDSTPRFYYGDVFPGDDGYWLLPNPDLPGSQVYYIECPFKINLMGEAYFYLDVDQFNCIDETSPYNLSKFTMQTNETNGIVNSSIAKIAVPTTPISQWFDKESQPYKLYLPPAERIRRMRVKLRYHNGQLVDFGKFNFTFTLEFTQYLPSQLKQLKVSDFRTGLISASAALSRKN
jgi:hypothetical protein